MSYSEKNGSKKIIIGALVAVALAGGYAFVASKEKKSVAVESKPTTSVNVIAGTDDVIGLAFSKKNDALAKAYEACLPELSKDAITDVSKSYDFKEEVPGAPTYHLVSDFAYPPFSFKDANGKFNGFDINVLMGSKACVEKKIGKFNIAVHQTASFDDVINGMKDGKYDIAASGISIKEERKVFISFGGSYITNRLAIVSHEGYKSIDEIVKAGKKITFQTGTTAQFYMEDYNKAAKKEGKPEANVEGINANDAIINGYRSGTVGIVLTDEPVARMIAK